MVERTTNVVRWFGVGLNFSKAWEVLVPLWDDLEHTNKNKVHPSKPELGKAREALYSSSGAFMIYEGHVKNCLAKPKDSVVISGVRGFDKRTLWKVVDTLQEAPDAVWPLLTDAERVSNAEERTGRGLFGRKMFPKLLSLRDKVKKLLRLDKGRKEDFVNLERRVRVLESYWRLEENDGTEPSAVRMRIL